MNIQSSEKLFKEAKKYIPGGVNSPVRAFKSVGGDPLFIKKGEGSKIWDVDGNVFIDYIGRILISSKLRILLRQVSL